MDLWSPTTGDVNFPGLTPTTLDATVIGGATPAAATFTSISIAGPSPGANGNLTITGYLRRSVKAGIVAGTTHTLAGATGLFSDINQVATVANASDAVALPAAVIGDNITIYNDGVHVLAVWPQAADAIDGGSAGVAVSLTNAKRCQYTCIAANTWESAQLGVASA